MTRNTWRRLGLSLAAVSVVGMGVLASSGVEETLAAWNDKAVVGGTVTAEWATGGWAKSSSSTYSNYSSFPERNDTTVIDTGTRVNAGGSDFKGTYGDTGSLNFGPSSFGIASSDHRNDMTGCAQAAAALSTSPQDNCAAPAYPHSGSQSRAKGFGRSAAIANPSSSTGVPINWIIGDNVFTSAECRPDGTSYAATPQGGGANNSVRIRASSNLLGNVSDIYDTLVPLQTNRQISGWVQPTSSSGGEPWEAYWHYTVTSRAVTAPGYALSDLYVKVDIYRMSDKKYMGTHESVLSRSECAVTTPHRTRTPFNPTFSTRNPPAYPSTGLPATTVTGAPLPDPTTGQNSTFAPALAPAALRMLQSDPGTTSPTTTTSATTTGSPAESVTATTQTTSAPPNPSPTTGASAPGTSTPTASLSSVPAPVTPGQLSPTESTVIAGNVQVDGVFQDVLARGATVPADHTAGTQALNTWINRDTQTDFDWQLFTSTDPTVDGWRWSALSPTTGTILYIR